MTMPSLSVSVYISLDTSHRDADAPPRAGHETPVAMPTLLTVSYELEDVSILRQPGEQSRACLAGLAGAFTMSFILLCVFHALLILAAVRLPISVETREDAPGTPNLTVSLPGMRPVASE